MRSRRWRAVVVEAPLVARAARIPRRVEERVPARQRHGRVERVTRRGAKERLEPLTLPGVLIDGAVRPQARGDDPDGHGVGAVVEEGPQHVAHVRRGRARSLAPLLARVARDGVHRKRPHRDGVEREPPLPRAVLRPEPRAAVAPEARGEHRLEVLREPRRLQGEAQAAERQRVVVAERPREVAVQGLTRRERQSGEVLGA
jgi:hypothetical protein